MKYKQWLAATLTASMAVSMMGCVKSEDSVTPEESAVTTENAGKESTEGSSAEETKESHAETTPGETKVDATTEAEPLAPVSTDTTFYLQMIGLDYKDARAYYEVTVNDELTTKDFDDYLQEQFLDAVTTDQLTLDQYVADPAALGIDISEVDYDPGSALFDEETLAVEYEETEADLKRLLAFPYESLTERQQLAYDKLYYENIMYMWGCSAPKYGSPLRANGDLQNIAITFYEMPFDTEEDVQRYARIMDYLPDLILEIYDLAHRQAEDYGYYPTESMLESAKTAIQNLSATENNPFIDGYNQKLDALGLDKETTKKYKAANEKFFTNEVVPALLKLEKKLEEFEGKNPEGTGVASLPDGRAYYEYLMEEQLGMQITPEEAAALLMDSLQEASQELVAGLFPYYSKYNSYYANTFQFDNINKKTSPRSMMELLVQKMQDEFPALGDVEYQVEALPKSLEVDGVLAYYLIPPVDAAQKNVMRYNSSDLEDSLGNTFATMAHEGYPGHMLQANVLRRCGAYPVEGIINKRGYMEGWSMFVEGECYRAAGMEEGFAEILKLDSDINYQILGLADIGVNGLNWTVEDLTDAMMEIGMPLEEAQVQNMYSIVVSDPGTYLPYTLGKIATVNILDTQTVVADGDRKAIYEKYLSIGCAPLSLAAKVMKADLF